MKRILLLTAVSASFGVGDAPAAILVNYGFAGGAADMSATTVASGVTATDAVRVGINEDTSRSDVLGLTSANSTYGDDDYVLITLDAGAFLFDFDTVDVGTGNAGLVGFRTGAHNGSTGEPNGVVTSISIDFDPTVGTNSENIAAATWIQLGAHTYTSTSGSTSVGTDLSYGLAGLGLSGTSSLVAIRIDTARTATWNDSYIDDLTVEGLVAPVPEPSTTGLLAGFLGLVMIRRRRG